jgi:hypothetical protein
MGWALVAETVVVAGRALAPTLVGVVARLVRQHRAVVVVEEYLALLVRAVRVHGT